MRERVEKVDILIWNKSISPLGVGLNSSLWLLFYLLLSLEPHPDHLVPRPWSYLIIWNNRGLTVCDWVATLAQGAEICLCLLLVHVCIYILYWFLVMDNIVFMMVPGVRISASWPIHILVLPVAIIGLRGYA